MHIFKKFAMGVMAVAMGFAVGCSSTDGMSKHDVTVSLAAELTAGTATPPSVRVDIIAVNPAEAGKWETYPMSDYWWKPESPRNGAEKYEMAFAPGNVEAKTLAKSNPIWDKWGAPNALQKSGMQLFVLADLPALTDQPGGMDDRRVILPLDDSRWDGEQPIHITVLPTRLRCDTSAKEPKKKN